MSEPLNLDQIERTGAVRFDEPVIKAVFFLRDGRRVEADVPVRNAVESELRFTTFEALIIDLFQRMEPEVRLKGVQIASLLKEDIETLKKHLANLVRLDVLVNDRSSTIGYGRGSRFPQH